MKYEEHIECDQYLLHNKYPKVQLWIDSRFTQYMATNPYLHWLHYHHIEAITSRWGFGTPEYNSAYLHILCDFIHHFDIAYVPSDRDKLKSKLKELGVLDD